jgi:hypothetical protein
MARKAKTVDIEAMTGKAKEAAENVANALDAASGGLEAGVAGLEAGTAGLDAGKEVSLVVEKDETVPDDVWDTKLDARPSVSNPTPKAPEAPKVPEAPASAPASTAKVSRPGRKASSASVVTAKESVTVPSLRKAGSPRDVFKMSAKVKRSDY